MGQGSFGSGFLLRLPHGKVWLGLEDPRPQGPIHTAGRLGLVVGQGSQFLGTWGSFKTSWGPLQHDSYVVDSRYSDEVVMGKNNRDLWGLELFCARQVNNILPLKVFLSRGGLF